MEKLTPIFVILVKYSYGNEVYGKRDIIKYLKKPDKFGVSVRVKNGAKEFIDRNEVIELAKTFKEPCKVYHYGFKERGFRPRTYWRG